MQEILQVLDGTTGLNMLPQAREFNDVIFLSIAFYIKMVKVLKFCLFKVHFSLSGSSWCNVLLYLHELETWLIISPFFMS